MVEFEVDMGCLKKSGELDCVILHDENGEMEDMKFIPEPMVFNNILAAIVDNREAKKVHDEYVG